MSDKIVLAYQFVAMVAVCEHVSAVMAMCANFLTASTLRFLTYVIEHSCFSSCLHSYKLLAAN